MSLSGEMYRSKLVDRDGSEFGPKWTSASLGHIEQKLFDWKTGGVSVSQMIPETLMMLATGHDSGATSTWKPSTPDLCPQSSAPGSDLISQPLSSLGLPVSDSFCPLEADK